MIWLIGNRGMLGSDVEKHLKDHSLAFTATDRDIDITNHDALKAYAKGRELDWIVNCSAYTSVDDAEEEYDRAFAVNADGVMNIARVAAGHGARFIHISTDYVFSGDKKGEYAEYDAANPTGEYGRSKLEGERRIIATMNDYFIIRTAWLYGASGNNFVRTMLRLFGERDEVRVVNDQWGSPTYTGDLAGAIVKIIDGAKDQYGIYHYTNEGRTNWFEFARYIYTIGSRYGLVQREVRIVPITTAEYPTRALRPMNSYLSKDKIRRELGIMCRRWEEALEECMQVIACFTPPPGINAGSWES